MTFRTVPRTTPYAWPYDEVLDPARTGLLVVTPSQGLGWGDPDVADRVAETAGLMRRIGGRVIHVVTLPPPDPGGGGGATGSPPGPDPDHVVHAAGVDGFYASPLDAVLRAAGCDHLLLTGLGLETCIHSTLRSANDRGFECLLVLDACTAYRPELVTSARSQVEMSGGIFGAVASTADVLAAYTAAFQGALT